MLVASCQLLVVSCNGLRTTDNAHSTFRLPPFPSARILGYPMQEGLQCCLSDMVSVGPDLPTACRLKPCWAITSLVLPVLAAIHYFAHRYSSSGQTPFCDLARLGEHCARFADCPVALFGTVWMASVVAHHTLGDWWRHHVRVGRLCKGQSVRMRDSVLVVCFTP